ncbi:hypothetical protein MMC28_004926 [Mycoblastus sanguinarius]|nr:hypothetical protein [Mycoblastus sanguinarius]
MEQIARDAPLMTFGETGYGSFDVQLPRRFSSADGTCVIDVVHKSGAFSDSATGLEIVDAAKLVIRMCVRGNPGQGGMLGDIVKRTTPVRVHAYKTYLLAIVVAVPIVIYIADHNTQKGAQKNLLVLVRLYNPTVACFGPSGPIKNSGQALLDLIPTSTTQVAFGKRGVPGVDVVVPQSLGPIPLPPPPYNWQAEIDIMGGGLVIGRWFDLWAGAVAINAICVATEGKYGHSFSARGLRISLFQGGGGAVGLASTTT